MAETSALRAKYKGQYQKSQAALAKQYGGKKAFAAQKKANAARGAANTRKRNAAARRR